MYAPPEIIMNEMNKMVCLGASFESLLVKGNPLGFDCPPDIYMNEMNKMVCLGASFKSLLGKGNPLGFDCPPDIYMNEMNKMVCLGGIEPPILRLRRPIFYPVELQAQKGFQWVRLLCPCPAAAFGIPLKVFSLL